MRALLVLLIVVAGPMWAGCGSGSSKKDGGTDGGEDAGWDPPVFHQDVPYVQEVSTRLGDLEDVRDVVLDTGGTCHVATAAGVMLLDGEEWIALSLPVQGEVFDLAVDSDGVLAVAAQEGAVVDGALVEISAGAVPRFVGPRAAGGFWIAGEDLAGFFDGTYHSIFEDIGLPVQAVVDLPDGTWLAATAAGIRTPAGELTTEDGLPSDEVRALAIDSDGAVWAGTDAGLARRDPVSGEWTAFLGQDGLHYGDVADLTIDKSGALLVSTPMGGSVYHPDGGRRYYLGRNWMPADDVRGMARAADGTIWFATAGGVARVDQVWTTLAERAELYDAIAQERHVRLGYTSTQCHLRVAGDLSTAYSTDDDNDGQWTAMYLASQCFRYAVTGEPEARQNARVAAYALMKLEQVTGVDGFFARSIVPGDECEAKQQGSGEWHLGADGQWCWKGDTSSDEFVGHVFGLSLFYDLVADEDERADVARTLGGILGYVLKS